jgi:hypothetical protein
MMCSSKGKRKTDYYLKVITIIVTISAIQLYYYFSPQTALQLDIGLVIYFPFLRIEIICFEAFSLKCDAEYLSFEIQEKL